MYVDIFEPVPYMVNLLDDGTLVVTLMDGDKSQAKLYFKDTITARKVIHDLIVEIQAVSAKTWGGKK